VLGNIFIQMESRGVDLGIMVQCLYDSGNLIDWIQFYEDSVKAKWNTITTIKKIKYSLDDVFGVEYSDQIINRLKLYIVKTNSITNVVQE
jgi:hypothetical protein